jgi:hypothetical protein
LVRRAKRLAIPRGEPVSRIVGNKVRWAVDFDAQDVLGHALLVLNDQGNPAAK